MINFPFPFDNTRVTVELREIVESGVNVWAFDYPSFYQGDAKTEFEKKVVDHYYFRQIGQETVGRWLHMFRTRMREIMPYYIQLYESQALMQAIEDPFGNVNVTETYEETRTGSSTGETTATGSGESKTDSSGTSTSSATDSTEHSSENTRKFSNTPQGSVSNLDSYLTEATVESNSTDDDVTRSGETETEDTSKTTTTDTTSATSSGSSTETVRHTFTKAGNQGVNTYAHDMKELREIFLNIDLMIINELKDLFLQVY